VASFNFKLLWAIIVSFSLAIPSVLNFALSAAGATPCFQLNEHAPILPTHPVVVGFIITELPNTNKPENRAKTKKA